ncbi:hypothetical protein BLA29_014994 [Euroglyphus maynei]|uniref:Uncharacterized protein n=1 Tax=Euroglyphus maynei TaxID=6958 RepID=A0A1Y3BBP1_EURMA|nr:hypothetical protein BLA29_014994 [Euroglyphus maynei]
MVQRWTPCSIIGCSRSQVSQRNGHIDHRGSISRR